MANTNASVKKKNTRNTVLRVLLYVVIIAICLITLYPYFVTVCTALKSRAEIFSMNELFSLLRPSGPTSQTYGSWLP